MIDATVNKSSLFLGHDRLQQSEPSIIQGIQHQVIALRQMFAFKDKSSTIGGFYGIICLVWSLVQNFSINF